MSAETSKLALWFSKPPLPKVSECLSLLDSVQRVSLAIVSAYYGLPKEQGLLNIFDTSQPKVPYVSQAYFEKWGKIACKI